MTGAELVSNIVGGVTKTVASVVKDTVHNQVTKV